MHQKEISDSIRGYLFPIYNLDTGAKDLFDLFQEGAVYTPGDRNYCEMFVNFVDDRNIAIAGDCTPREVRGNLFFVMSALNTSDTSVDDLYEMSDFLSSQFVNYIYKENDLVYKFYGSTTQNRGVIGSYRIRTLGVPFRVQYLNK